MFLKKLLTKSLLVAAGLGVGANGAWAVDVPTPVYFNDFSSVTGLEIVGNGEFITDDNANFGQIFHNDPTLTKAVRTNYLKLPSDVLQHSATTKEMTIGFWVNKKGAADYYYAPIFTAYGSDNATKAHTWTEDGSEGWWPYFYAETRGVISWNSNGYYDFSDAQNDAGTNTQNTSWIDDGNWHYFTMTFTNTSAKVYIDGIVLNSWTIADNALDGFFTQTNLTYVCLGGNQAYGWNDLDPAFGFDDFAVYDAALSQEQIFQVINKKLFPTVLTYDFASWASGGCTSGLGGNYRVDGDYKPYIFNDITKDGETVMKLNSRFLGTFNSNNWQFSSGKLKAVKNSPDFCISQLSVGDKIRFTFSGKLTYSSAKNTVSGATICIENDATKTNVTDGAELVSGTTYIVTSVPHSTLMMTGYYNNGDNPTLISCVEILPVTDETMASAPIISLTGVDGTNRTIRIQAGLTGKWYTPTTTYYTIDGTEPTTATATNFTGYGYKDIVISSTSTIKALSVATSNAQVSASAEASIEAGTELVLAEPIIAFTSMTSNAGLYSPLYVISNGDNSGLDGAPTPILSATFNGETVDITSGTFTPNGSGTIVVTASHEGYISANAELTIKHALYTCQSTPNFNEIPLANLDQTLGGTWEDDGSAREANWSKTGGVNADLTTNGGESYYKYKLKSGGEVTVGSWFTFSRNRGSSSLRILAGYGLGEKSYAPSLIIKSPVEDAIVEYCNGKNTPATLFVVMSAADETAGQRAISLQSAEALRYCKYYAPASVPATVTSAGWATLFTDNALDFSGVDGLTAYTATCSEGTVTLTEVQTVPAGTGVVLKGAEDSYSIPVIASSTTDKGELLGSTTEDTDYNAYAGFTLYMLSKVDGYAQFVPVTAGSIAAGKAFLKVANAGGARALSVVFAGEASGIAQVEESVQKGGGAVYNLQGQRVGKAVKGLYIVDGKKVLVK